MTREDIEKKAVERFPVKKELSLQSFTFEQAMLRNKENTVIKEKQQAFIEGALMVMEANEPKVVELLGNNPPDKSKVYISPSREIITAFVNGEWMQFHRGDIVRYTAIV